MTRFLFLVPDYRRGFLAKWWKQKLYNPRLKRLGFGRFSRLWDVQVWGGTLNLMRHCQAAREAGLDAYLATASGHNTYADLEGFPKLPCIRYQDHLPTDVCIYTDIFSWLVPKARCFAIVYEQSPLFIHHDFDHRSPRVTLWTDSNFMLSQCQAAYPGVPIAIVPNIVDHKLFSFIPQRERTEGELIAFPRKGPDFIEATMKSYESLGGRYWHLHKVDGLTIEELGKRFRTPQAFLASADVEGCALPPQECMASGILVIGKNAEGANFIMQHDRTALVGNTPEEAAHMLIKAENQVLRERLCLGGYEAVKRYFWTGEPTTLWKTVASDPRWTVNLEKPSIKLKPAVGSYQRRAPHSA